MQGGRGWIGASVFGWLVLLGVAPAFADEGMWTFDRLPLRQLEERYQFTPSAKWIRHLQHSAVRFGGASGSFVSPDGLVFTNHHVAFDQLQKLSTPENNYVRDGFLRPHPGGGGPLPRSGAARSHFDGGRDCSRGRRG